ncbi:MAG: hypothetical protein PHC36_00100 [Eubacteriales bacterium]|nr:hypothetical protein [Eubacteriales bacterium]MDD4444197.1 hypothetical protein [Eubacteriales bacterium]
MNERSNNKQINWIAVLSGIIVIASVFLPYYTEGLGRIGGRFSKTLIEIGSGYILVLFAVLSVLFAMLRKKAPLVVFSTLTLILEGIMFFVTLSELPYSTDFVFNYVFYISVGGSILLLCAQPIFNRIQKV